MKIAKYGAYFLLIAGLAACGSTTATDDAGSDETGTLVMDTDAGGGGSGGSLIKAVETSALASQVLIGVYQVTIYESEDCSGDGVELMSNTDDNDSNNTPDEDDCVGESGSVSTTGFRDMADGETLTEIDVSAGSYNCIKVRMCDQLVWQADLAGGLCDGTNVLDTSGELADGETNEADVTEFCWSTAAAGMFEDGDDRGSCTGGTEAMFSMDAALTVAAGETTNATFTGDNSSSIDDASDGAGFYGRHESESDADEECDIPAPSMSFE